MFISKLKVLFFPGYQMANFVNIKNQYRFKTGTML
jgi:hypothetical protein